MYESQQLMRLIQDPSFVRRAADPSVWIEDPPDRRLPQAVEHAELGLYFRDSPPATALGNTLISLDREARRIVRALDERRSPADLRKRGTRLGPTRSGLVVERAEEGSLDVVVLLGGLYGAVVSQPLSFALNLASIIQYGHLIIEAVTPTSGNETATLEVPTSDGLIKIPVDEDLKEVELDLKNADGSTFRLRMTRES